MKIPEVSENAFRCPSKQNLIVQTITTYVSNRLINFPMCTECKKEGQKPIERPKTKDQNSFTLFVQNNEIININNNNLPPSLAKFSSGDRNQGINKCWPKCSYTHNRWQPSES